MLWKALGGSGEALEGSGESLGSSGGTSKKLWRDPKTTPRYPNGFPEAPKMIENGFQKWFEIDDQTLTRCTCARLTHQIFIFHIRFSSIVLVFSPFGLLFELPEKSSHLGLSCGQSFCIELAFGRFWGVSLQKIDVPLFEELGQTSRDLTVNHICSAQISGRVA